MRSSAPVERGLAPPEQSVQPGQTPNVPMLRASTAAEDNGEITQRVLARRYRISSLLAEGGMARIYAGEHIRLAQPIAVKILKHRYKDDPEVTQLFLQEARLGAWLRGPYVADALDVGCINGGPPFIRSPLPLPLAQRAAETSGPSRCARAKSPARQSVAIANRAHAAGRGRDHDAVGSADAHDGISRRDRPPTQDHRDSEVRVVFGGVPTAQFSFTGQRSEKVRHVASHWGGLTRTRRLTVALLTRPAWLQAG